MSKITSYLLTAASSSNHLPRGIQAMIINGGARIQVYGIHERQETTTCTYTIVITGIPE